MRANPPGAVSQYSAKDYFAYGVRLQNLGAASTLPGNFTVDADADFLWQKGSVFADVLTASTTYDANQLPNVTILITDTSSGRALSNIALPISSLFGTGQLPFILPVSKLIPARSSIGINVTNPTTTVYTNIYVSFIGTKLFKR